MRDTTSHLYAALLKHRRYGSLAFVLTAALIFQGLVLTEGAALSQPPPDPSCQLYPIAVSSQALEGIEEGQVVSNLRGGRLPGNFGWLSWTGQQGQPSLVRSLTSPGDSDTYVNPNDTSDRTLGVGDAVFGRTGVAWSRAVRESLDRLATIDITVPVWDAATGRGGNASYRVARFAVVRLIEANGTQISFRFVGDSDCASIPVNSPPLARAVTADTAHQGVPVSIRLHAADDDDANVDFAVRTPPSHGTLSPFEDLTCSPSGEGSTCTATVDYTADLGFAGGDSFTYEVTDGDATSLPATVTIVVGNVPPSAHSTNVRIAVNTPTMLTLEATDADGDSLTHSIVAGPTHGALEGSGGTRTYTPADGYSGQDAFTFQASDGIDISNIGTVTITVGSVAGGTLVVDAATLRVRDVGSTATLGAFIEVNGTRTSVTGNPGTSYTSSNPAAVSVDPAGKLYFLSEGSAAITVTFGGLTTTSNIEVSTTATPFVGAPVGPAGGAIVLPGGPKVDIPPDALETTESIRIEEVAVPPVAFPPEEGIPVGSAYDFTPGGLTFGRPVDIVMSYNPSEIPAGLDAEGLLISWLQPDGRWAIDGLLPAPEGDSQSGAHGVDLTSHSVVAQTNHFSLRQLTIDNITNTPTTLVAPDGTELQVFQHFKRNGQVTCGGATANVPNRAPGHNVDYVVLHNTSNRPEKGGTPQATFTGEVSYAARTTTCTGAHYYVDKDGTIVQVYADSQVARHIAYHGADPDNPTANISRDNSIGIEIFNNHCGPTSTATVCAAPANYPGTQLSAVIRLVDFLMREHPVARPGPTSPSPLQRGGVRMHADIGTVGSPRTDPEGAFRIGQMGPPSLEDVVYQALREEQGGIVRSSGGDAMGAHDGGNGGNVLLEFGNPTLENPVDDARPSLIIPAGTTQTFTGPTNLMHLIVDGTLLFTGDTSLDVDGTFYVSPTGRIEAKGTLSQPDGHDLTVVGDGIALMLGEIDISGENASVEDGPGGNGGNFAFRTAAPGPVWVPTIITRGGDGDTSVGNAALKKGGDGGSVRIVADSNNTDDRVRMDFGGTDSFSPDLLPPPPPFNQMPAIVADPFDPPLEAQCRRPLADERLPLGRADGESTGANISAFTRGILTVGGIGSASEATSKGLGGPGGVGGSIEIVNATRGHLSFGDVDLLTGAGVEVLCYKITIASLGASQVYGAPSGGLGGKGSLNSGDGGMGGAAGAVFVEGNMSLQIAPTQPPATTPIVGHDTDNPNFEYSRVIGVSRRVTAPDGSTLFEVNATGGSGGSPGGSASTFPGRFGAKGNDGAVSVVLNGIQYL